MKFPREHPHQGKINPAQNKKYHDLIFFVHSSEKDKEQIQQHIDLVNNFGFDAFTFLAHDQLSVFNLPITSEINFGFQHQVANQIEQLLNQLDGKKIIFSFSQSSSAAIEAIAHRAAYDVSALICDSGPAADVLSSAYNTIVHEKQLSTIERFIKLPLFSLMWNLSPESSLYTNLKNLPKDFKILSIRGWKDKLIPASQLDLIFEPHSHLDWRKLSLPRAEHQCGLKDSPDEYKSGLGKFLSEVATKIL